MNIASATHPLLARRTPDMSIDWEFQPSMQHLVVRAEPAPGWAETMPADFDAVEDAGFREPLEGLSMRDLDEPEIFRVFFGNTEGATGRAR